MGCYGILTTWLERHRAKKPDGVANQSRNMEKEVKKIKKEKQDKAKGKKAGTATAVEPQLSHSSDRRHRSPPLRPLARRALRMAADLKKSTGLNARVSGSGIAYTLDFRPGTPALRPAKLNPLRKRCAFSFEEKALIQDVLRRDQIIKIQVIARQESVKRLEAERRRLKAQSEKCEKVKQGETKCIECVHNRKKDLKKLAQKTLDMRVDLVLKSERTKRAMNELGRRE